MSVGANTVELDGQYRQLCEGAGWLARERVVRALRGPDAATLLQGQLTNEIEAIEPGRGCYAALLDRKGHLQADMRVLRIAADELLVDLEPVCAPAFDAHFRLYRLGSDVEIDEPELRVVSLIGPAAPSVAPIPPLNAEHDHAEVSVGAASTRAVATDVGIDLLVATDEVAAIASAIAGGGAVEVTEEAAEVVRVESGRPRFGHEMDASAMPAEAGITDRAVSFTKGCYIGQETVARLHYRGKPNRHLRGLMLDLPAAPGDAAMHGDREVGRIGTAVLSPARGPLALAILRREAEVGATILVGAAGLPATVVELPFADGGQQPVT